MDEGQIKNIEGLNDRLWPCNVVVGVIIKTNIIVFWIFYILYGILKWTTKFLNFSIRSYINLTLSKLFGHIIVKVGKKNNKN